MTMLSTRRMTVCAGVLTSLCLLIGPIVSAQEVAPAAPSGPAELTAAPGTQPAGADFQTQLNLSETVRLFLPDPTEAAEAYQRRAASYTDEELRTEFRHISELALRHIQEASLPSQTRLSLQEAVRRALLHSYAIRVQSYSPAIEASRVIQAEARFDAAIFFNYQDQITDRPIAPQSISGLQRLTSGLAGGGGTGSSSTNTLTNLLSILNPTPNGSQVRSTLYQGGFRKLLASGAQVRTGFESTRTHTNQALSTLNPQYNDDVFFEITQPFLRNFGLDVTKSEIKLRKLDQQIAQERYVRQVQQTIQQVEQTYWNLVQARRLLPVVAELLAQTQRVLTYFEIRRQFDVQPVQIANTQARLENRRAELIAATNRIRDAEAQLKALINDPSLPIPAEQEIIPTDIPALQAVVLNRMVELKTAMENRPELAQARYAVDSARVGVTVANNQRLPQLDVFFRYTSNGLGGNPDAAFKQMSSNDFVDYVIGVQFEYPIGNRAAEAGYRQARLTMAQAVASVKQVVEQVILEVDVAYRNLQTLNKQILPNAGAVVAEEANLTALQQRTDRRDPTFLDLELNTQASLALTRQNLLSTWVQHSIGIVNIEFAKGTLLAYNNVRLEPRWDDPAGLK
jgi:outer membrane protein TolC